MPVKAALIFLALELNDGTRWLMLFTPKIKMTIKISLGTRNREIGFLPQPHFAMLVYHRDHLHTSVDVYVKMLLQHYQGTVYPTMFAISNLSHSTEGR